MAPTDRFSNAFVGEKIILAFDYSDDLAAGEALVGTPSIDITLLDGSDSNPAAITNGQPQIVDGQVVLVPIDPTVADVDYRIKVLVPTSNPQKVLACVGRLYVEP